MSGERPIPVIAPSVLADLWAHADAGHPEEICGLLIGAKDGTVIDEVRRCENRQNALHAEDPAHFTRDARTAYNLGPKDLFFLDRSLRSERPVLVIYHSHVEVGAYFSAEDKVAATLDGELLYPVDYLVIDAKKEGARGAKLFRFRDGDFVEIATFERAAASATSA